MQKLLMAGVVIAALVSVPLAANAGMSCDDASFSRAQSAAGSLPAKAQDKMHGLIQRARDAKAAGKMGQCSNLLSKVIGKAR